jgi:adenylate cyclase
VVFSDIQGFSALSEKLKERVVPIINEYMGRMMPIIRANEGTWDKFIGDGIMFFFNAPLPTLRHAAKAVATVLQMHRETARLADELATRDLPRVSMRAGICTGPMIVGDAGSLNKRFYASSYTVLGDLVNLASRLEAANKFFGTRTLVLRDTMHAAGEYLYRPIAKLRVYGKQEVAEVFEPLALRTEASGELLKRAEMSERIAMLFRCGQFPQCAAELNRAEQHPGDATLWKFYREQIAARADHPATEIDGAFNLTLK